MANYSSVTLESIFSLYFLYLVPGGNSLLNLFDELDPDLRFITVTVAGVLDELVFWLQVVVVPPPHNFFPKIDPCLINFL